MTKVTNKHDAPLNVAGVDVRPGATVNVDQGDFEKWSLGNAASQWLKAGLIESDAKPKKGKEKDDQTNTQQTERERLEALAAKLGIDFTAETSDEDLTNAIAEAEQDAAKNERDGLLTEARNLGLNPNANISTEKLKAQIAEKKASGQQ